jgi:hypothetical protein
MGWQQFFIVVRIIFYLKLLFFFFMINLLDRYHYQANANDIFAIASAGAILFFALQINTINEPMPETNTFDSEYGRFRFLFKGQTQGLSLHCSLVQLNLR